MIKDNFGMRIFEGNRVIAEFNGKMVHGIVKSIDDGGPSLEAQRVIRPGHMVVNVELHFTWMPKPNAKLEDVIVTLAQPATDKDHFEIPKTQ